MKAKMLLLLLLGVIFVAGAGLSVAMLISAISFLEWGRVVLYSVTLGICVEAAVLCFMKCKSLSREQ